jgi:uncharacterized protein YjbI with pentapeptide repeats
MNFDVVSRTDLEDKPLTREDVERLVREVGGPNKLRLSGRNLKEIDLSDFDLNGADLLGADLSEADLSRAFLRGAHLSGADGLAEHAVLVWGSGCGGACAPAIRGPGRHKGAGAICARSDGQV